jgi:copper chaperone NosL
MAIGCSSPEIKPVDIYAEDMCSQCRMAISDHRFASEIITNDREAFKFDDIGCMENFRERHPEVIPAAVFVKDYESRAWISIERSTIVTTDLDTPMGSGKVAFADSSRAREFAERHPAGKILGVRTGWNHDCCTGEKD